MSIKNAELGLTRNIRAFLINSFSCFAIIWTFIEAISALLISDGALDPFTKRFIFIFILGLISLIYGLGSVYPKSETSIKIGSRNTKVTVKFGDVFQEKGIIVIPASQFFESEIEEFISPRSLQAQFIQHHYNGNRLQYKKDITTSLSGAPFVVEDRGMGIEKKYPLGESPVLKIGQNKFIHVAITETEIKKFEPPINASLPTLMFALKSLWRTAIAESVGERVIIPLLGSGITGIALPPQKILELNLIAIQEALLSNHTISEIVIVLHYASVFSEIDLSVIH